MSYYRPETLDEALAIRAETAATLLAGGTDVFPARANARGWGHVSNGAVLDLTRIEALKGIEARDGHYRIGALATWSELIATPLPPAFDALKAAAREVGGLQVQNRGTIVGNLCNASPAADGVPALLCLDADVVLAGPAGRRRLPLAEFVTGNRRTALGADEIAVELLLPASSPAARSAFLKLGSRRYLVISIVMAAGILSAEDGVVAEAALAVGACSPVARRLPELERALIGTPVGPELAERIRPEHLAELSPIDDVRAAAAYRLEAAETALKRLLAELARQVA